MTCRVPQPGRPVVYHSLDYLQSTTVWTTCGVPQPGWPAEYHSLDDLRCTTARMTCSVPQPGQPAVYTSLRAENLSPFKWWTRWGRSWAPQQPQRTGCTGAGGNGATLSRCIQRSANQVQVLAEECLQTNKHFNSWKNKQKPHNIQPTKWVLAKEY